MISEHGIAGTRLLTEELAPADREGAYLAAIDHCLDTKFLSPRIHADLWACYLGAFHVIRLAASARRSERTAARIAHDRYDGLSIQLAIGGGASGATPQRRIRHEPGTLMLLDFGQPFYMVDAADREVVNVALPRAVVARHVDDVRALHGVVLESSGSRLLAATMTALGPELETSPTHVAPAIADSLLALLLVALGLPAGGGEQTPVGRRHWLVDRAERLIDGRLGSADVTPEWLQSKLNVSRSDLYSAFEEAGGVARFIWRRRLEAARAALLDHADSRRIGEIAFALGFASEAHFSRAFRAAFGKTPSETRRDRG